jgi:hypothetical protein
MARIFFIAVKLTVSLLLSIHLLYEIPSLAFFGGSIGIDEKQICTRIRGIHLYSGTEINGRPLAHGD